MFNIFKKHKPEIKQTQVKEEVLLFSHNFTHQTHEHLMELFKEQGVNVGEFQQDILQDACKLSRRNLLEIPCVCILISSYNGVKFVDRVYAVKDINECRDVCNQYTSQHVVRSESISYLLYGYSTIDDLISFRKKSLGK